MRFSISLTDARQVEWLTAQKNQSRAIQLLIDAHLNKPAKADLDLGAIRAVFETVLDERLLYSAQAPAVALNDDPLNAFDDLAED